MESPNSPPAIIRRGGPPLSPIGSPHSPNDFPASPQVRPRRLFVEDESNIAKPIAVQAKPSAVTGGKPRKSTRRRRRKKRTKRRRQRTKRRRRKKRTRRRRRTRRGRGIGASKPKRVTIRATGRPKGSKWKVKRKPPVGPPVGRSQNDNILKNSKKRVDMMKTFMEIHGGRPLGNFIKEKIDKEGYNAAMDWIVWYETEQEKQ